MQNCGEFDRAGKVDPSSQSFTSFRGAKFEAFAVERHYIWSLDSSELRSHPALEALGSP